jgi:NAD(P)-dependent dehydrogenase (short-subunit alcohol dehydrogenase family)
VARVDDQQRSRKDPGRPRIVVVSGGTDGMGRALALTRAARGDTVVVLGSNAVKGEQLLRDAAGSSGRVEFIRVDLASIRATRSAVAAIAERHEVVDALTLFANRQAPARTTTVDGLEKTFAVYYLSRYLLGHGLSPLLHRSPSSVIVNVAGVGTVRGGVHWDDLQLEHGYRMVTAQLQAGRANDLLGVAFSAAPSNAVPYVLYHPGFTRSGDLTPLPAVLRVAIRAAARVAARPIEKSIAPIDRLIDQPPEVPLTAIDRGRALPLTLPTLDAGDAERLAVATAALLAQFPDPGTL